MSLPENDVVRLQHMLGAAQQALLFCVGHSRADHAYFDIDADVLWASVNEGLPPLAAQLRAALRPTA